MVNAGVSLLKAAEAKATAYINAAREGASRRDCARPPARPYTAVLTLHPPPPAPHPLSADRKALMRKAQADARREIDEYRAAREAKLHAVVPEAAALEAKVARVTAETDRKIAALDAEYAANKEKVLQLAMQVVMNVKNPFAA